MGKKKKIATKTVRVYPSTRIYLKSEAQRNRIPMAEVVERLYLSQKVTK